MKSEPIPRLSNGDTRLRVLWIEDLFDQIAPKVWLDWEPWFSVTIVDSPIELASILNSEPEKGQATSSPSPFDIYLTDFRLCDAKGPCKNPQHIALGVHTPAAGFVSGLMMALQSPQHIQCVIPYSGYDEEYGDLWRLVSRLCPTTIEVLWDESATKNNRRQDELRRLGAETFRTAVSKACNRGASHIQLRVQEALEKMVVDGNQKVPGDFIVSFSNGGQMKDVKLGALFNDHLSFSGKEYTVPPEPIAQWLREIKATSPIEKLARHLASLFWWLRSHPYSRLRYNLVQQAWVQGAANVKEDSRNALACDWLGKFVDTVASEDDRASLLRLTTLLLLIRELTYRESMRQNLTGPVALLSFMREKLGDPDEIREMLTRITRDDPRARDRLVDMLLEVQASGAAQDVRHDGEPYELVRLQSPLGEIDVCQLLDPWPKSVVKVDGWGKDKKIGQALKRVGLDVIGLVKDNDHLQLTNFEKAAARRYAIDLRLLPAFWPSWIQT